MDIDAYKKVESNILANLEHESKEFDVRSNINQKVNLLLYENIAF